MTEIISGIAAAVVIIIITEVFAKRFTIRLIAATVLVAIAFIYVGFSLQGNPVEWIIPEIAFALVLYFLAMIGYKGNHSLIAYGIIAHGLWDIAHHNGWLMGTQVPDYWPSFCFVIDIIDGIYFLVVFRRGRG